MARPFFRATAVLSVLDWADPPTNPVYPRRMLFIAIAILAAAAWVGIVAVVVEKLRARRADVQETEQLTALRQEWDRMPHWIRALERLVVR